MSVAEITKDGEAAAEHWSRMIDLCDHLQAQQKSATEELAENCRRLAELQTLVNHQKEREKWIARRNVRAMIARGQCDESAFDRIMHETPDDDDLRTLLAGMPTTPCTEDDLSERLAKVARPVETGMGSPYLARSEGANVVLVQFVPRGASLGDTAVLYGVPLRIVVRRVMEIGVKHAAAAKEPKPAKAPAPKPQPKKPAPPKPTAPTAGRINAPPTLQEFTNYVKSSLRNSPGIELSDADVRAIEAFTRQAYEVGGQSARDVAQAWLLSRKDEVVKEMAKLVEGMHRPKCPPPPRRKPATTAALNLEDLGMTYAQLRSANSSDTIRDGSTLVKAVVEHQGLLYAPVEWTVDDAGETFVLRQIVPVKEWRGSKPETWQQRKLNGGNVECLNGLLVAGPDGVEYVIKANCWLEVYVRAEQIVLERGPLVGTLLPGETA